jgi:hypothetical protein
VLPTWWLKISTFLASMFYKLLLKLLIIFL